MRSMDKWTPIELYTRIGQLYLQKLSLLGEAFGHYAQGHGKARRLLAELTSQSKQFVAFVAEAQQENITLKSMIDAPVVHLRNTLDIFKQLDGCTPVDVGNMGGVEIKKVVVEVEKLVKMAHDESIINVDEENLNNELSGDGEFFMMSSIDDDDPQL